MSRATETDEYISPDALRRLGVRDDLRSSVRMVIHLGLFGACFTLLATTPLPALALAPTLLVFGFLFFSLYAPFHECTHQTAFRTKGLNTFWGQVTGLLYGYSLGTHKAFHFAHHRRTNLEQDPEKGYSLPPMPGRLLAQILLIGALCTLVPLHSLLLAVLPTSRWDRAEASWAAPDKRAKLAWECRALALCWVVGVAALARFNPALLLYCFIGIFIGRTLHGLVSVTEHEGLPSEGHQLERTRTVLSNAVFRWFWWNMNYHAEHHAWPSVPWHQLPAANSQRRPSPLSAEPNYVALLGRMLRSDPAQNPSESAAAPDSAELRPRRSS